jgi:hypothetical protein
MGMNMPAVWDKDMDNISALLHSSQAYDRPSDYAAVVA